MFLINIKHWPTVPVIGNNMQLKTVSLMLEHNSS